MTELRILIIDDSEDDSLLLLRELRKNGYQVHSLRVDTPQQLIQALEKQNWDIILTDYVLPKFSGIQALQLIRQKGYDIPCIMLSGTMGEEVAVESMRAGASDYILKDKTSRLAPVIERELHETHIRRDRKRAINEREQLWKEREHHRQLLEQLVDNAPIGIAVVQLPDMDFILSNPTYRSIPGIGLSNIKSTESAACPNLDFNYQREYIDEVIQTGQPKHIYEIECQSLETDDTSWWNFSYFPLKKSFSEVGKVLILAQNVTDQVSSRRQLESMAHAAEVNSTQMQAIINHMNEAVIIFNVQGDITLMNPAALKLYGYASLEEAKKHTRENSDNFHILYDMEDRLIPPQSWPYRRVLQGETLSNHEVMIVRPDTGKTWIGSYNGTAIRNAQSEVILGILTLRDVTPQKQQEEYLQEMNQALESRVKERTNSLLHYQEQLRSLASQLTLSEQQERRRISSELHDYLAQTLVVCRMKLGRLQHKLLEDSTQNVDPIITDLDTLLDQSLTYTRTLMAELSPVILYESGLLAAAKWLASQMQLHHNLTVRVESNTDSLPLPEDHSILVYQTIRELLMNILKHAKVSEAFIQFQCFNDSLQVTVEDQGVGFNVPDINAQRSTLKSYGLFSVRERLEALGGRVEIQSKPGSGTQMMLYIPLRKISQEESSIESTPKGKRPVVLHQRKQARESSLTILLVDDHTIVREGIRSVIESYSEFQVIGEAGDGEDAIEQALYLQPDVIVMDVNMPKKNGIEATRIIKQEMPGVTIVGLTVNDDDFISSALKEAGASYFLTKGGPAEDLYRILRTAYVSKFEVLA